MHSWSWHVPQRRQTRYFNFVLPTNPSLSNTSARTQRWYEIDNIFYHDDSREVVIGDMGLARQLSGDSKYYNSTYGKIALLCVASKLCSH